MYYTGQEIIKLTNPLVFSRYGSYSCASEREPVGRTFDDHLPVISLVLTLQRTLPTASFDSELEWEQSRSGRILRALGCRMLSRGFKPHQCLLTHLQVRGPKRLGCHAGWGQQVSQRWIWGIQYTQMRKHTSEGSTMALKRRADVTRCPKQGYEWPYKK